MPDEIPAAEPVAPQPSATEETVTGISEEPSGEQKLAGAVLGVDAGKVRSLANLKPFEPGKSGNPSGRSKKKPVTASLEKLLSKKVPRATIDELRKKMPHHPLGRSFTYADLVAFGMIQQSLKGNTSAFAHIANRVEGRVPLGILDEDEGGIEGLMETFDRMAAIAEAQVAADLMKQQAMPAAPVIDAKTEDK